MTAHPLVTAEWPHITELPAYDFQSAGEHTHIGVYVRRVSGDGFHTLVGLVNHVVVAPEARGNGHGRGIVRAALEWLVDSRVPFAHVHCADSYFGFYRRVGFQPAPNFPAPSHRGPRLSMVAVLARPWPDAPVRYVEPW